MAERGFVDSKALAEAVPAVPYGSLRNAVAGTDPIRLQRVYDIARVLKAPDEELRTVVEDILATADGGPDEARDRPKDTRRDTRAPSSPKRPTKAEPKRRPASGEAA